MSERAWRAASREFRITPDAPLPMAGYGSRTQPATGTHDDLHGRVLALGANGRSHLLIVLDVLWITPRLYRRVGDALRTGLGLDESGWSLIATHTHGGPELDERTEGWMERVVEALVDAARDALAGQAPAELAIGRTVVDGICVNRRNGHDVTDAEMTVLSVRDAGEGDPIALLCNFTCHPVVLGPDNLRYTADYPGYLARTLQAVYGESLVPLFTCGAAGDVNTGHAAELSAIGEFIPHRTYARAEQIGRRLAGAAVQLAEGEDMIPVAPRLAAITRRHELPFRDLPDEAQLLEGIERLERDIPEARGEAEARELKIHHMYDRVTLAKLRERRAYGASRPTVLQVLRLGETLHYFVPGELFVELGLRLKRHASRTGTVHGYANDYVGYLPTTQAWHEGGYEQVACPYPAGASEALTDALEQLVASGELTGHA